MIQQTGITLNNSHLLRAAMAFAVIGVIGPGLFQLTPPQWLGSDAPEKAVEVLSPPAEVGGEVALPEELRRLRWRLSLLRSNRRWLRMWVRRNR